MRNFLVPITFFCLWISGFFDDQAQQALALVLIFSFGILHGSNDLLILNHLKDGPKRPGRNFRLLSLYVLFVVGIACFFYFLPALALCSFILYSAFHFGEQHWVGRLERDSWIHQALFVSYGLTILLLLFSLHAGASSEIMQEISGVRVSETVFIWAGTVAFTSFLGLTLMAYPWRRWIRVIPAELFLLAVFFVVFRTASLLWAFAIYFILWHALPSLMDQVRLLYGSINRKNSLKYLNASAVYWGAALGSLAVVYFFFRDPSFGFLPLFFSFLAAITFPHVWVMSGLYRAQN
ncbi:Brp/Blh family beta-carotene 15,15'-dioxygenase [Robiginitalea sp. SC105]|uniref:Brp/Blh family beta-carotene 15,15'-dioxygenase n=1 Tax=Robiginitalea sp. SC105 TaxID=2762332 RepID=UPI00163AC66B|nr:Brp/Blh family beta-carotene 15,15'-dioxygenase [Robiginitalea sp. SC105]MBC2839661.1 Brp/Blh family beta-carotene 15,15'-dioxygenase [Robiginitalea sp. SC105]